MPLPPPEREKARAQRERALEFAKQVPKPKAAPRVSGGGSGGGHPNNSSAASDGGYGEASDVLLRGDGGRGGGGGGGGGVGAGRAIGGRTRVDELEARHVQLKQTADAIRREMGF